MKSESKPAQSKICYHDMVRWKETISDGYLPISFFAPNKFERTKLKLKKEPETFDQILK